MLYKIFKAIVNISPFYTYDLLFYFCEVEFFVAHVAYLDMILL